MFRGEGVSSLVWWTSTGSPSVGKAPHTRDPLPGAGGNSVMSQEARAVTAPCGKGKGEGAQRSPRPRSLYTPPPPKPPKTPASGALTFLGGGCMMLKGHQSSAHPRRRRLKDCEGEGEQGWRKGGGPASQSARALACVCVSVCERRA